MMRTAAVAILIAAATSALGQTNHGAEERSRGVAIAPPMFMESEKPLDSGIGPASFGQAATARHMETTWTWAGGIYLHAVGSSGQQVVGDVEIDLDVSFSDLFGALESAFSGHFEGRNGDFALGVDYMRVKVGQDGVVIGPAPESILEVTGAGALTTSAFEFFGTYRIGDHQSGPGALDAMAGGRYKSLETTVDITGLPMPVGGRFEESWWDVLFGGRWLRQAGDRALLIFRADLGSDAWNVQAGVGIKVWRSLDVLVEYRHLKYNRSTGSGGDRFVYDASESGPLFGMGFHF